MAMTGRSTHFNGAAAVLQITCFARRFDMMGCTLYLHKSFVADSAPPDQATHLESFQSLNICRIIRVPPCSECAAA